MLFLLLGRLFCDGSWCGHYPGFASRDSGKFERSVLRKSIRHGPFIFPRSQVISVVSTCIVRNRWRDGPRHAKDTACDIDTFAQQSCQRPKGKVLLCYSSVRLQHLLTLAFVIFFLTKYEICEACVLQGRLWFCRFSLALHLSCSLFSPYAGAFIHLSMSPSHI